jgi:hypothetical protein
MKLTPACAALFFMLKSAIVVRLKDKRSSVYGIVEP